VELRTGRALANLARTYLARAGLDRRYFKVFAIGLHKTGTRSIHQIFGRAGLSARHSTTWPEPPAWLERASAQAFSDGTATGFAWLDRTYPRSRFILNVRDLDEWLDSWIEHRVHRAKAPSAEEIVQRILNRNNHHQAVLDHFASRPDDLLIVNYIREPDAAARIAAFLGRPDAAGAGKPHIRNRRDRRVHGELVHESLIRGCLQYLGIPKSEWSNDLHCPSLGGGGNGTWPGDTSGLGRLPRRT
jgi:hypothetical protein